MTLEQVADAVDAALADVELAHPITVEDCVDVRDMIAARGVRAEVHIRDDRMHVRADLLGGGRIERVLKVRA